MNRVNGVLSSSQKQSGHWLSVVFFCNGRLLKPFSMVETGHYPVFGIESG